MNLVTTKFLTNVLERVSRGKAPPPLSVRLNFPSLRLGEMLAQYLNGHRSQAIRESKIQELRVEELIL